jgi:hypothetical protein
MLFALLCLTAVDGALAKKKAYRRSTCADRLRIQPMNPIVGDIAPMEVRMVPAEQAAQPDPPLDEPPPLPDVKPPPPDLATIVDPPPPDLPPNLRQPG